MRKILLSLLLVALCASCAHESRNPLATWVPSPNHNERKPVLIVLHATEQESVARSIDTLRGANGTGPVSAHYLIGRDGRLYQLVADERRAWHAGVGRWGAITDLNSASIGIELDNDGVAGFPPEQVDALIALLADLCERHAIPRTQVIAHADLAPTRKRDPNASFPWQVLAQAGFGLWPQAPLDDAPTGFDAALALRALGYGMDDPGATLRAFRRRFRGIEADLATVVPFEPDAEDRRILHALTRLPPPVQSPP
jgi:N-acetylmuramoyl-L-alanine amidase